MRPYRNKKRLKNGFQKNVDTKFIQILSTADQDSKLRYLYLNLIVLHQIHSFKVLFLSSKSTQCRESYT